MFLLQDPPALVHEQADVVDLDTFGPFPPVETGNVPLAPSGTATLPFETCGGPTMENAR